MIILIDGYNVLKLVYSTTHVQESIRNKFIKQLTAYGKHKGHSIVLVFDGGPYAMSTHERYGQATVVYAGYQETADDYIKKYLDRHRNREILLVTHDRELVDYARRYDIPTMDVWPFYERVVDKRLQDAPRVPRHRRPVHKLHPDQVDPELDAMFEQADILEKVEYEHDQSRISNSKRLSKQEKYLQELLKKL